MAAPLVDAALSRGNHPPWLGPPLLSSIECNDAELARRAAAVAGIDLDESFGDSPLKCSRRVGKLPRPHVG